MVFGWRQPVVVIPKHVADGNRAGSEYCLSHEWAHISGPRFMAVRKRLPVFALVSAVVLEALCCETGCSFRPGRPGGPHATFRPLYRQVPLSGTGVFLRSKSI